MAVTVVVVVAVVVTSLIWRSHEHQQWWLRILGDGRACAGSALHGMVVQWVGCRTWISTRDKFNSRSR